MKRRLHTVWGIVFAALLCVVGNVSHAQSAWKSMQAGANQATIDAAVLQCQRGGLSRAECDEYRSLLESRQCQSVMVKDDTHYVFLGGRNASISRNMVKQLGKDKPSVRCRLKNGTILDWFTGFKGACNNVGKVKVENAPLALPMTSEIVQRLNIISVSSSKFLLQCCPQCGPAQLISNPSISVGIESIETHGTVKLPLVIE